ncbi:MAG: FAD:protein FMN transferase [Pseudomonadales bacterium]|nr:FAD:protein FMN transferase [Pseudomonadales bacterium]
MYRHLVKTILFTLFALLPLAGCSSAEKGPELVSLSGPTMGTQFHVKYYLPTTTQLSVKVIQAHVEDELARVNQRMSTYLPDSELSRFNRSEIGQWFPISQETAEVVSLAQQISSQTQGAFDVTVASLVDLWGFGPSYRSEEPPAQQLIETELKKVGYSALKVRQSPSALFKTSPVTVDLSAIAKGYAVDKVADALEKAGIQSYMVEVGGEIRAKGLKTENQPWRIAIESPLPGQRSVQRVLELTDIAVATSGDYRNYFEKNGQRYSHTIDPTTGYPITHALASVTVLAETSARADALATALMVMGPERALNFANENRLPVFMIVKQASGFSEIASDAFAGWLK